MQYQLFIPSNKWSVLKEIRETLNVCFKVNIYIYRESTNWA